MAIGRKVGLGLRSLGREDWNNLSLSRRKQKVPPIATPPQIMCGQSWAARRDMSMQGFE